MAIAKLPPMIVWLPALSAVVAAGLILLGRRGRRIDDHPLCRRCGYDLSGSPAEAMHCSECGASLARRRARRMGHRRAIRSLVILGLLLLLPSLTCLGLLGWIWARGADIDRYKPVALLIYESGLGNLRLRDAALRELLRRLGTKQLTAAQAQAVLTRGMEVLADPKRNTPGGWDLFFDAAYVANALTPQQWGDYWRTRIDIPVRVRPCISEGDPLPLEIGMPVANPALPAAMRYKFWKALPELEAVEVDGVRVAARGAPAIRYTSRFFVGGSFNVPAALRQGDHHLRCTLTMRAYIEPGPARRYTSPTVALRKTIDLTFRRIDQDSVTARTSLHGEEIEQLRKSVRVDAVNLARPEESYRFDLNVERPPVALAMQAYLRIGRWEGSVGSILVPANQADLLHVNRYFPYANANAATLATIILRPDRRLAAQTVDVQEIFGGEITISDVPIK